MVTVVISIVNGILIANLCLTKITSACPYALIFINTLSHTFSFSWQAIAGRLFVLGDWVCCFFFFSPLASWCLLKTPALESFPAVLNRKTTSCLVFHY